MPRTFYVITYDIPGNRRRLKMARLLERYGERVQYSVFEMWLTADEWKRLSKQIERLIAPQEDQVRVYRLCAACRERIVSFGESEPLPRPGPVVVI